MLPVITIIERMGRILVQGLGLLKSIVSDPRYARTGLNARMRGGPEALASVRFCCIAHIRPDRRRFGGD